MLRTKYSLALRDDFALSCAADRWGALRQFAAVRPPLVHLDLGRSTDAGVPDEEMATLREILSVEASTKVVVSGHAQDGDACRMLRLGAVDYLPRPVDL